MSTCSHVNYFMILNESARETFVKSPVTFQNLPILGYINIRQLVDKIIGVYVGDDFFSVPFLKFAKYLKDEILLG